MRVGYLGALVALYMSVGTVSGEREHRTLVLRLTTPITPITPKQYLCGKLRGLVGFLTLILAAPMLTITLVSLYMLVAYAAGWKTATFNSTP